jgi:hypothetical protein
MVFDMFQDDQPIDPLFRLDPAGIAFAESVCVTRNADNMEPALAYANECLSPWFQEKASEVMGSGVTNENASVNEQALEFGATTSDEFDQLMPLLADYPPHPNVEFIVCTNRLVLAALQQRGWLATLKETKVQVVVDTCVVVTPIVRARHGVLMTNSGKFAHYTPGNIGLQVVFGSLQECVRSGALGRVWRDKYLWY